MSPGQQRAGRRGGGGQCLRDPWTLAPMTLEEPKGRVEVSCPGHWREPSSPEADDASEGSAGCQ